MTVAARKPSCQVRSKAVASASSALASSSTDVLRRPPARSATSAPSVTPATKPAISPRGTSALAGDTAKSTPSRVVLPDMNEAK